MDTQQKKVSIKEVFKMKDHLLTLSGEEYQKKAILLVEKLNLVLNNKELLKSLTKQQLFDFISLCSTHRPTHLHSILISLSANSRYF